MRCYRGREGIYSIDFLRGKGRDLWGVVFEVWGMVLEFRVLKRSS